MIDIFKIINFIKSQWLGFIVILLWILYCIFSPNYIDSDIKRARESIKVKEHTVDTIYKNIDSIEQKIKIIKIKGDERIKYIDTMSVSELQEYFTKRYPISKPGSEGNN